MNINIPDPLPDPKKRKLQFVIDVDSDLCVNCHKCISACPTKFVNDGSKDYITLNPDLCIGCGECLKACTHEARFFIDDMPEFIGAVRDEEKIVALVAPSIAANFPEEYLHFNGWLKELGIEAVFDVSFGAELTVRSYVEYIKKFDPKCVIAQPCPAIVTYIETFKPELLDYLAPVDSPMLHAIKMIREYNPEYKDHKIAIFSPCLAKKREFNETGLGDYNIGYRSIEKVLAANNIVLKDFPKVEFDNPSAERAVLFSSPGGLMKTVERWIPDIAERTRKIEGVNSIYEYLDKLPELIEQGRAPLIVDCLNCDKGCNGGTLTIKRDESIDELEYWVENRRKELQKFYEEKEKDGEEKLTIEEIVEKYWKEGLYNRNYVDRQKNFNLRVPNEIELKEIYRAMHKYSDNDLYNCASCGYEMCEKMAFAIFNGLNKPGNCHFYLSKESERANEKLKDLNLNLERKVLEKTLELRDKNRQVMDSIKYSEKIQRAILPNQNRMEESLNNYFVIYKPKDILSGDLYWFNKVEGGVIAAVIDCSGQGIPGSMLSMIGFMVLNDIVVNRGIIDPAEILTELNNMVNVILKQRFTSDEEAEGMDISLCMIRKGGENVIYSGAKRPLYVVREGVLQVVKADDFSIGADAQGYVRFTNKYLDLAQESMIYLTTDGLNYQFDKNGKIFGEEGLIEMIKDASNYEIQMQKLLMMKNINTNLKFEDQADDITIIGIKMLKDTVS